MTENEKAYLVKLLTTATDTGTLLEVSERLREMSHREGTSIIDGATLGAAAGIISGVAKGLGRYRNEPAAAGQPDNITSLDV